MGDEGKEKLHSTRHISQSHVESHKKNDSTDSQFWLGTSFHKQARWHLPSAAERSSSSTLWMQ